MKTQFLWLLLFVVNIPIQSQNILKGSVKDIDTDQPLTFANIYIPELEKGSISNEDGHFIIENLPNGSFRIICSIVGYETYSSTISIPIIEELKINLYPSVIEMEAVILSTPFHKLQRENVMKVEHVKMTALKTNGAINLAEGITMIPGVENISTGLGIGKPVIRGLSSNRVLVYTQGVRLENQQFGGEHGLGLNAAGIESIEVIKGPASLLYGSDALGGVLYINPEKFAPKNTSSGDMGFNYFSNTQGYTTNAGYKLSSNKLKFIFRGSLGEHSDYKTNSYRTTNSRFQEQDFKSAIGYHSTQFNTEFRYNLNASKLGIPEEIGLQSKNKNPLLPYQNIHNHVFSSKSKLFLENSSFELNLGYIYNNRKEFEEHHDEGEEHEDEELEPALQMKLKTFNYDLKYNLPNLGIFETIVGIQGMNQTNTNYGEETLIPDATTNDFGLLGTSHIHFEKLDVQLGARFDRRSLKVNQGIQRDFNSFNAALGFKKDFSKIIARLNFATGFRAPNLAELTSDGSHEGANRYEIGNPNLNNEQNIQIDISLEHKSEHVEVFANGFYNHVSNFIFLAPNGEVIDEDPVYLYLQNDAKLYGGEFGLHFHPHPLDWMHVESSFETVIGKQNNGDYLPLIPANTFNNTIRFEMDTKHIKKIYSFIKLSHTLKQNHNSINEISTGSYSLLSAGFGGELSLFNNPLTIRVSGSNLTNKDYISHLSRLKVNGISNIGRNISFGISYKM